MNDQLNPFVLERKASSACTLDVRARSYDDLPAGVELPLKRGQVPPSLCLSIEDKRAELIDKRESFGVVSAGPKRGRVHGIRIPHCVSS